MTNTNYLLQRLHEICSEGRIALCGYFLAGYPTPDAFYRMVRAARDLDVIEFGIPADVPALDGPVIANAHEIVTRERGIHAEPALALIGGLAEQPQPRFVMTYTSEGRALDGFLRLCVKSGVHGVLVPDIDLNEGAMVATQARNLGLASITLLDIRADEQHVRWSAEYGDVVYLKAAAGQTGGTLSFDEQVRAGLRQTIEQLKAFQPEIGVAVGIGLQTPEQVQQLATFNVDMAVFGTKLVENLSQGENALARYIQSLKAATARPHHSV
jgi:tryptophan synthase alpha chain